MTPGDPIHLRSFTGAILTRRVWTANDRYVRVVTEADWLQYEKDGIEPFQVGFVMADVIAEPISGPGASHPARIRSPKTAGAGPE